MSWETRKGTGRYYTRTYRLQGRLVREYVGTGQVAKLAAQEDQTKREQRLLKRQVQREEKERHTAIWEVLRTLARLSSLSLKEAFESAGYHSHKGQWRKQRGEVKAVSEKHPVPRQALDLKATSEVHPVPRRAPVDMKAVTEIMEAVKQHRPGAIEAFEALMKELPEIPAVHGDLSRLAEDSLLRLTAGDDDLDLEMRRAWLAQTREKLAEPGDGELERQLIHRFSLNLLAVSYAEASRAQMWRAGWSQAQANSWDQCVSRYQNELFRASRALRESRRLARPIVLAQMNIAQKQQINITAANPPIEATERE